MTPLTPGGGDLVDDDADEFVELLGGVDFLPGSGAGEAERAGVVVVVQAVLVDVDVAADGTEEAVIFVVAREGDDGVGPVFERGGAADAFAVPAGVRGEHEVFRADLGAGELVEIDEPGADLAGVVLRGAGVGATEGVDDEGLGAELAEDFGELGAGRRGW